MGTEERMTVEERYKYLRKMHQRYAQASRAERTHLLDEIVTITGLDRKYACHLMNKSVGPIRKHRQRQRGVKYGARVQDALRVIAETLDWVCAERMTPVLLDTAHLLAAHQELVLDEELEEGLSTISISTVDRLLARLNQDVYRLPRRRGRKHGSQGVAATIPAGRIPWDTLEPGHFELDTVVHGGSDPRGEVVYSMQMIDVATGWSERGAMWGRSQQQAEEVFATFLARCPFPILEIHPDNGSEFMNHHLLRFWGDKLQGLQLSRSRPWQRNDNRFVEQKNATLIRAYLGNLRLDTRQQCALLNDLYEDMWLYYNFYQPVLHQVEKTVTWDSQQVPHVRRRHDQARTPLQRLLETGVLSADQAEALLHSYWQTNPRQLRVRIEQKLDRLFATVP